jgi:Protein of unknown function (DUF2867)
MKPVSKPFTPRHDLLAGAQFADSYCVTVSGLSLDAIDATRRVMGRTPRWVARLMAVRNLAVTPFGLKTAADKTSPRRTNIGTFPVISQSATKVVLGLDDRHLDFRVLVEVEELGMGRQQVTASTVVKTHNLLGRVYLAIVKPFHRIIVPAMLAQVVAE